MTQTETCHNSWQMLLTLMRSILQHLAVSTEPGQEGSVSDCLHQSQADSVAEPGSISFGSSIAVV